MIKLINHILFYFLIALLLSLGVDRILGIVLNRLGYFKALKPSVEKIFDTNEFNISVKVSSQGLNNEEVKIPKSKDVFRILALGDSFTFGWGVSLDKSWVKILEKKLKVKGKKLEIINAGVPGAGFREEIQVCQAYGRFDPDGIIIGTFADDIFQTGQRETVRYRINNLPNVIWSTLTRIRSPIIYDFIWEELKGEEAGRLSKVWKRRVTEVLKKDPTLLLRVIPEIRSDWLRGKVFPELPIDAWANPIFLDYYIDPTKFNYALGAIKKRLTLLKKSCSKDLPVIELFIPDVAMIKSPKGLQKDSPQEKIATLEIDKYLKKITGDLGFYYISPLSSFRQDGCPECYYKWDHHLTVHGNKRFAEFIYPKIQKILDNIIK